MKLQRGITRKIRRHLQREMFGTNNMKAAKQSYQSQEEFDKQATLLGQNLEKELARIKGL